MKSNAAVLILMFLGTANATDDDCRGNSCNGGGDTTVTTGDVSVNAASDTVVTTNGSRNRAISLSNNMGDVDIAGCLGSTQFGTPLFSKQKLVINNVCLAEFYLNMKKYELAAMALCNVPGIIMEFSSEEECESAHDFEPIIEAAVIVEDNYDEEYRMEQQMRYEELEQMIDAIKPEVTEKVIKQPFLSATQRMKLQEVLDEDEE